MSAESPSRRSSSRCVPTVIPPQPVVDRSIIDSVTGFINEVALHSAPQMDSKEQIIWSRFETDADISDLSFGEDWDLEEGSAPPPLILTLGYGTGIQMWAIPANGEAIEVLSWRQGGPVKCLKILPTPLMEYGDQAGPVVDMYHTKRPLIAIADTAGSIVNVVSLRDGDTVKSIKFKHPVVDILANRTTVVITFQERIAVFDARTFEDRCTVTTCFPSPGLNPNPVALGARWMAYAELKMMPSKRSNGGCDGLVNTSAMASVISAAKTLGKGLKGIGETIGLSTGGNSGSGGGLGGAAAGNIHSGMNVHYGGAGGMGGGGAGHAGLARTGSSGGLSPSGSTQTLNATDGRQPGMITVMDIKYAIKDFSPTSGTPVSVKGTDPMVAHFVAHSDAIVNIAFDPSGMLLLTADRKGHDFNLFRIHPHPGGPSLAAVHHLYVLHRGDTTAKVQDICFSFDSRWVAVSSLRGTTHVFPITPYGGNVSIRTHGSSQVVNQLSRFHRSAGLSMDGRCSSPVTHSGDGGSFGSQSGVANTIPCPNGGHFQNLSNAYANPRVPPFAHPTIVLPLTQLRQPYSISNSTQTTPAPHVKDYLFNVTLGRQRHSSLSDDSMMGSGGNQANPLRVCATFARPRAWLLDPPGTVRDVPNMRMNKNVMDSLFIMASHGALIQYDLEPKHASSVAREKVCDDTAIELFVEAKAQWNLLRNEARFNEIQPPLPMDNLLLLDRLRTSKVMYGDERGDGGAAAGDLAHDDRWLSRVEIITHAGPHRRLWMGPQFIFKTYNCPSGSNLHHIEMESVEIGLTTGGAASLNGGRPARSNPMNMPNAERPIVPVFIESGSYSSYEQSPRFRSFEDLDDFHLEPRDTQLREDLADAMRDCAAGGGAVHNSGSSSLSSAMNIVNVSNASSSTGHMFESSTGQQLLQRPGSALSSASIENIVNPLGTVTTVVRSSGRDEMTDSFQSSDIVFPDQYIHENCDEAMFRPVVQVVQQQQQQCQGGASEETIETQHQAPVRMSTNLIVPVIVPTPKAPQKIAKVEQEEEERRQFESVAADDVSVQFEKPTPIEIPPPPIAEPVDTKPAAKQSKQKNKRNKGDSKEKSPPLGNAMVASVTTTDDKVAMKSNGSKGRKSSGQEPKAGKIRKSEKSLEIVNCEEELLKDLVPELETVAEPEFVQLQEVVEIPSKQAMEIIQDSLMKDTIVEAVTVAGGGGQGKKKKEKNRQKTPPKVDEVVVDVLENFEEVEGETKKMMVDISETKFDLSECMNRRDSQLEMYAEDPLMPLEPFDPVTFEALECPNEFDSEPCNDQSLMTFESPVLEKEDEEEEAAILMNSDTEKLHKVFTDRNLVFALCTSLREGESMSGYTEEEEQEQVNISSASGWQLEIHEDYMDLDKSEKKLMLESMTSGQKLSPVLTASTGSSEGEVSSSSTGDGKTTSSGNTTTTATEDDEEEKPVAKGGRRPIVNNGNKGKAVDEEDEELQPLIKDKERDEQFGNKEGVEEEEEEDNDVEGGGDTQALPVPVSTSKNSSKESTPTPGQGKGPQSSKKKSRKKKR